MARGQFFFKERELRRAIRAFVKEGFLVQGGRIDRDGNIEVKVGRTEKEDSSLPAENEWDRDYGKPAA